MYEIEVTHEEETKTYEVQGDQDKCREILRMLLKHVTFPHLNPDQTDMVWKEWDPFWAPGKIAQPDVPGTYTAGMGEAGIIRFVVTEIEEDQ